MEWKLLNVLIFDVLRHMSDTIFHAKPKILSMVMRAVCARCARGSNVAWAVICNFQKFSVNILGVCVCLCYPRGEFMTFKINGDQSIHTVVFFKVFATFALKLPMLIGIA